MPPNENPFRVRPEPRNTENPFRREESAVARQARSELADRGLTAEQLVAGDRRPRGGRNRPRGTAAAPSAEPGNLGVFLARLGERTLDAALAAPSASGDMLAGGAAAVEGVAAGLTPGGRGFDLRQRFRANQERFPANLIRAIPRFTTDDLIAGGRAALAAVPGGVSPGEQLEWSRENLSRGEAQTNEDFPMTTDAAEFGGNVAAMLITKRPLQGGIKRLEESLLRGTRGADEVGDAAGGVGGLIDDILHSSAGRLPLRGLFRGAEAGLEGAWLEALSEAENDPMLAAGLAGGTQVASSLVTTLGRQLQEKVPGGFFGAALLSIGTGAVALQMLKESTPGGRDRVLESIETSTEKVTAAVILATLGHIAGGRGRDSTGSLARNLPGFVEGGRMIPRTGIQTLLNDWIAAPPDEQAQIEMTVDRLMENPTWKGDTALEREVVQALIGELDLEPKTRLTSRGTRPVR